MNKPYYYNAVEKIVGENILLGGSADGPIEKIIFPEGISKPSEKEVIDKLAELQTEWDSQEYARNRKEEYPPLAEQLDLLWHAIDTDTLDDKDYRNKFYTRLKKVKEDNPKG